MYEIALHLLFQQYFTIANMSNFVPTETTVHNSNSKMLNKDNNK